MVNRVKVNAVSILGLSRRRFYRLRVEYAARGGRHRRRVDDINCRRLTRRPLHAAATSRLTCTAVGRTCFIAQQLLTQNPTFSRCVTSFKICDDHIEHLWDIT
jgi:hypothetical protein